jgi:hypothetical protein
MEGRKNKMKSSERDNEDESRRELIKGAVNSSSVWKSLNSNIRTLLARAYMSSQNDCD